MNKWCLWLVIAGSVCFSSSPYAQEDLWDDQMEQAMEALRKADLPNALKLATIAVRQSEYENADRHVTSLALLARIAQDSGDLSGAERALRRAIEIIDRVPGPMQQDKAVLYNNLGSLLDLSGDLPAAEQHYRSALALHREIRAVRTEDRFSLLVNLAGLMERRNDQVGARKLYVEAESLLPNLPVAASITLYNNLGTLLQRSGNSSAAQIHLARALASLPPDNSQPLLRATLLHNLGTAELEVGDLAAATIHLHEAESVRRGRLGDRHTDTARTLSSIALLLEKQNNPQAALKVSRESSAIIGASLSANSSTRAASVSAQVRRDWRESFVTHLRLLHGADPDSNRLSREALEILQMVKHGELARVFASASLGGEGELGSRVRLLQRQFEQFQANEKELTHELQAGVPNADRERAARQSMTMARDKLERMQADMALDFPSYHELVSGRIASLSEVQKSLGVNEATLIFFVAEVESFVMAITRESTRLIRVPLGRSALSKLVREIRHSVEPEHANPSRFAFDQAHALYRHLIAPAEAMIEGKAIWFVVPDGPLESLPLTLLLKSEIPIQHRGEFRKAPWVVRQHALVTLPSLGALTFARSTPIPAPAPEALIAFADPLFGDAVNHSSGISARKVRSLSSGKLWPVGGAQEPPHPGHNPSDKLLGTTNIRKRLANPDVLRKLEPLPETANEARAVAAILGGGKLMMRDDATEAKLKHIDLSAYRNLLFATHGIMATDLVEYGEPALVMTPPAEASEEDDGLLSAVEIAQLKLNADWVLLSACNTASADGTPGAEGMSGLAKAFFYAGARNLLVSHWSVVSDSTVKLTTGTYAHLNQHPTKGKAIALQRSMLDMIDSKDQFQHPMYWAPFVLVGDSR